MTLQLIVLMIQIVILVFTASSLIEGFYKDSARFLGKKDSNDSEDL